MALGQLIADELERFESLDSLLGHLARLLGKGYGKANLADMHRFYLTYREHPGLLELAKGIGWSHNRKLLAAGLDMETRGELLRMAAQRKPSAKALELEMASLLGQKHLRREGFRIHIEALRVRNFKSVVELDISRPNPLTVLVGSNACGKSNILGAIDLLFQAYYSGPEKAFDDRGGPRVANFRLPDADIEVSLRAMAKEKPSFRHLAATRASLRAELKDPRNHLLARSFSFLHIKDGALPGPNPELLDRHGANYRDVLASRVLAHGPTREAFLRHLRRLVPDLADLRAERSPIDGSLQLFLADRNYPGVSIPHTLASDGTRNMLILLAAIFQSQTPRFICIEEPENGLHPSVLPSLAETLRAICHEEGHAIWLTTHSPTLVRALRREELLVVDKRDGQTLAWKASERRFDKYFAKGDLPLDEAWLTDLLEGGLP